MRHPSLWLRVTLERLGGKIGHEVLHNDPLVYQALRTYLESGDSTEDALCATVAILAQALEAETRSSRRAWSLACPSLFVHDHYDASAIAAAFAVFRALGGAP